MTETQIKKLHKALQRDYWGDIDPNWFKYLDLNNLPNKKDRDDEFESHVAFQRLLQSIK